jgi:hypothetical protein
MNMLVQEDEEENGIGLKRWNAGLVQVPGLYDEGGKDSCGCGQSQRNLVGLAGNPAPINQSKGDVMPNQGPL